MSSKNRPDSGRSKEGGPPGPEQPAPDADQMSVGEWRERRSSVRRLFPGPRGVEVPLRVAFERRAYADISAHAKESLDEEICGVLVGTPCRDEEGDFVHVEAVVAGSHAEQGGAHVTFTQDTWNAIHATMECDYPKLQIVGWYHSHPGFGVEFSEMDIFIQKNFFSGSLHIGLVTDPLGGETAVCMNSGDGIQYLPRFWVDAREQKCYAPAQDSQQPGMSIGTSLDTIESLETRINQLIQTVDDVRRTFYRWIYTIGTLVGLAIVFSIAGQVSFMIFGKIPRPPSRISFAPIPVDIDGKACLLGVDVVSWQVPPELIAVPEPKEEQEKEDQETEGQNHDGRRTNDSSRSDPDNAR